MKTRKRREWRGKSREERIKKRVWRGESGEERVKRKE